ncbi:lanthionine synthetase LanC family protein [Pedobacter vanadiisoli]|uniref:Lanthionine synthetase LanC family protein n=1 Tax=Pedobacter vanadiisoli TaxID=1761975 RepID=A0ABW5MRF9_9SPHI
MEAVSNNLGKINTQILLPEIIDLVNKHALDTLPNFGVGHGKGGAVLLNCLYASYTKNEIYYAAAERFLEAAFDDLNPSRYKSTLTSNYYLDIAEFGSLLIYLEKEGHIEEDYTSFKRQIDDLLAERVKENIAERNFGMSKGAIGIGFYLINRASSSTVAQKAVLQILYALDELKEGNEVNGYFWTTHYFSEPRVYTGLAHGSAMVLNFLSSASEAGIEPEKCAELMHYGLKFLLQNRMDSQLFTSVFPLWIKEPEKIINHCLVYGDIGTSYAIIRAAQILKDDDYLAEGIQIALETIKRKTKEETFLNDASVKYGVCSPCLIYSRIYELTGIEAFKKASAYWEAQIPSYATGRNKYLGFKSFFFGEYDNAQLDLNFGLIGIALTIMQCTSDRYKINQFTWLH